MGQARQFLAQDIFLQMNSSRPAYILWLPSWYPSRLEPYDGDFIQRHARAASRFIPIHVLYFVRDKEKLGTDSVYIEEKQTGDLFETIVYYSQLSFSVGLLDKFFALQKFRKVYWKVISDYFARTGPPALVHVHIAFKAGTIARWIKRKYAIPFLLSEHWTIYLNEARPNFEELGFFKRCLISKTITGASKLFSVSDYLGRAIKKRWPSVNYKRIPNVVDASIFYPDEKTRGDSYHLIHISNLNYQKNPEQLFGAIKILKQRGVRFSLDVFGTRDSLAQSLVQNLDIADVVNVHSEVPQQILAKSLRKADLLILYSRYETFGCVIIEANACGVPAIVADIPVMHELITQNENGVFVKPGNPEALAVAVIDALNGKSNFNSDLITNAAKRYSYSEIGKMFLDEYRTFLNPESG